MLTAIKEIINPDVVLNIATGDKVLTLKEEGADSKVKKLHIQNVPENAFAFTLDYQPGGRNNRWFKQLSSYVDIRNSKGVNKGCDLVLLIPQLNQQIILIFDLKSKKPNREAAKRQLTNSELYVRYLMTMVQAYYGIETNSIQYKRAIVTTAERRGIPKTAIYRPNEKTSVKNSFHIQTVRVNSKKEAHVYLNALLK